MADTQVDFKVITNDGRRILVEVKGGKGGPRRIYVPVHGLGVVFTKNGVEEYPAVDGPTPAIA